MSEFDVIVYGATGFTGQLVAEYFNKNYSDHSWAIAGRSASKMKRVSVELGLPDSVKMIEADASNPASLNELAKRAKVIITTVGPYQLYGEPLVAACVENGTDYVDLCGEPPFMWQMIEKYDEAAKASGARIVHSCGFDSIPSEMGVYFLQDEAKKRSGKPIRDVKGRLRRMKGSSSGGTIASGKETMKAAMGNPDFMKKLLSSFALTPGFEGPKQPYGNKPYEDTELGSWVAPFFMAPINTKNVHRSNYLLGFPYGEDFTYEEMMFTGPGERGEAIANQVAKMDPMVSEGHLQPGDGPSREERESGNYDFLFTGVSEDGERISVGVTGDRDPGYGSTSKIITECAMCLLNEAADTSGGVLTPAPVFGMAIVERLRANAGLTFEVES